MDPSLNNAKDASPNKTKLLIGLAVTVTLIVILGVSQDMTSVFTGSVTKKEQKTMDLGGTWLIPNSVSSSDMIVQTIDIGNAGPSTVKKILLLQPLQDQLTFFSVQTSDPIARASCTRKEKTLLRCVVDPAGEGLSQDGHLTVIISLRTHDPKKPSPCGQVFHSGNLTITSEEKNMTDADLSNNSPEGGDTLVDCSDITAEVSVNAQAVPTPVTPAGTMEYVVTASNNGPGRAKGAKIHQKYPDGLTFAGASVQNCQDNATTREVICNPGDDEAGMQGILEPGQSSQIELNFAVNPDLAGCTSIAGNSSITIPLTGADAQIDPVPENNQADLSTEVACN